MKGMSGKSQKKRMNCKMPSLEYITINRWFYPQSCMHAYICDVEIFVVNIQCCIVPTGGEGRAVRAPPLIQFFLQFFKTIN